MRARVIPQPHPSFSEKMGGKAKRPLSLNLHLFKSVRIHDPSPSSPQESLLPEFFKDRTYFKFALIINCLIMKFKDSRLDNRSDQHF